MHRSRLPIASPCSRSLDAMPERGEGRRWCEDCERHVHDLSAMRESEALALLHARAGESVCVAYRADRHRGEVQFRDRTPRGWVVAFTLLSGCLGFDSPDLELPDEPEPPAWDSTRTPELQLPDRTEPASFEPPSLDPKLGEVRVLVMFDGEPVANASIQFSSGDTRWTGPTDVAGRWAVALPPGDYTLRFQHGERPGLVGSTLVLVQAGESIGVEVTFAVTDITEISDRWMGGISLVGEDPVDTSTVREKLLTLLKHARRHSSPLDTPSRRRRER